MEFFAAIFAVLATLSWGLTLTFVIGGLVIGSFLEDENVVAAVSSFIVVALIGSLAFYGWRETLTVIQTIPENIGYFTIYLVIGLVWSIYKWILYVRKIGVSLSENVQSIKARHDIKAGDDAAAVEKYLASMADAINSAVGHITKSRITKTDLQNMPEVTVQGIVKVLEFTPGRKKSVISGWIVFWPCSMIVTLIRNLLVDLVDFIVETCRGVYNRISAWAVSAALGQVADESARVRKS